mgnify:CR=1 FL=1
MGRATKILYGRGLGGMGGETKKKTRILPNNELAFFYTPIFVYC